MNLNRLKRGFTRTNPEKGLRDLPGARKSERHNHDEETIRIKGRYIPSDTDRIGHYFGIMGYLHAWIYVILLPCSIFSDEHYMFSPLSIFLIGLFIVHGCAMFADSFRHSEAPWARKGIKIFWICTLAWSVFGIINSFI